ncbi:hypothetical protein ACHQM5_026915 [Ranunculus cassubicifolius]
MTEMLSQPTEEGKERTPDEVRDSILGKRPGYACGLGYGYVAPTQRTAAATTVAREEMDQLRQRAETAENQLREVLTQQSNQQRLLEQVMSRLGVVLLKRLLSLVNKSKVAILKFQLCRWMLV